MKIFHYTALVLILISSAKLLAHRNIQGTYIDRTDNEPICLLNMYLKDTFRNIEPICSAFLIAPNIVITALHCITNQDIEVYNEAPDSKYNTITCPNQNNQTKTVKFYPYNVKVLDKSLYKFLSSIEDKSLRNGVHSFNKHFGKDFLSFYDIAIIILDDDYFSTKDGYSFFTLSDKNIIQNPTYFTPVKHAGITYHILNTELECRIAGYGHNNENLYQELKIAKLDSKVVLEQYKRKKKIPNLINNRRTAFNVKNNKLVIGKRLSTYELGSNLMADGDSGGPMYCRTNNDDAWTVIGVASTVQKNKNKTTRFNYSFITTKTITNILDNGSFIVNYKDAPKIHKNIAKIIQTSPIKINHNRAQD